MLVTSQLHRQLNPDSATPAKWIALRQDAKTLPGMYRGRLPARDGWGSELLAGTVDGMLTVISCGLNRIADTIDESSADSSPHGDDIVLVSDGGH